MALQKPTQIYATPSLDRALEIEWRDKELTFGLLDRDGEVDVTIDDEDGYKTAYLSKEDAVKVIIHLQKQFSLKAILI